MSETKASGVAEPEVGSYFVANYPPFSVWTADAVAREAKPALATLAIFTILGAWNDLIWPLVVIGSEHNYTIQLGLANFQGTRRTQWSLLMAGNVVATMPLIIAFVVAQKHFVATMTFSGLKG